MQFLPTLKRSLLAALMLTTSAFANTEPPNVLVSIKPLQLIAQAITDGVTDADVLLPPGSSPHSHSLKPSDARKLRNADVVFWVGPAMEAFLPNMFNGTQKAVSLMDIQGVHLLGGEEEHHHEHEHNDHHDHGAYDPHIWLSTDNARAIATEMSRVLISIDGANRAKYQTNLERFLQSMDETDKRNLDKIRQSGNKPFFVFHNAYGYLQKQYGLTAAGYFTKNPEQQPGARHLVGLQGQLDKAETKAGTTCIFREPQFKPAYIDRLTKGLSVRVGVLDPLGENITPGPESYARFINQLVDKITSCTNAEPTTKD